MDQYDAKGQFTQISARQWAFVTQENLSAKEAVAFLLNGMQLRTFQDVLRSVCGSVDLENRLTAGLCANAGKPLQPDSVRRKVRNWMAGKSVPSDREEVFQICFALDLDQDQADRMLSMLTDQGIHYRNPKEMAYAYCLRYHLGYRHACGLAEQLSQRKTGNGHQDPVTQMIRQEFQTIRAEEDLFSFVLRMQAQLGTYHNTAYHYFCKMLALLTGENLEGERCYSMEYVANTYLRLNIPQDRKTGNYSDIQKIVKKYWPGARSIKAMKSRSEDVSRKALLLLYLVTGGVWEQRYDELDEAYIQPREFLETHCMRMNQMLTACGMRTMDPRSAFDYLVLYCLRPEEELFMSDRMAALAAEIFGG